MSATVFAKQNPSPMQTRREPLRQSDMENNPQRQADRRSFKWQIFEVYFERIRHHQRIKMLDELRQLQYGKDHHHQNRFEQLRKHHIFEHRLLVGHLVRRKVN